MIALTLLLHLWAQGQPCAGSEGCNATTYTYCCESPDGDRERSHHSKTLQPPAEHVVEIRTKRETRADCRPLSKKSEELYRKCVQVASKSCGSTDQYVHDCWMTFKECQVYDDAEGAAEESCQDVRVTHELWIDGVKFGTLKETDGQ